MYSYKQYSKNYPQYFGEKKEPLPKYDVDIPFGYTQIRACKFTGKQAFRFPVLGAYCPAVLIKGNFDNGYLYQDMVNFVKIVKGKIETSASVEIDDSDEIIIGDCLFAGLWSVGGLDENLLIGTVEYIRDEYLYNMFIPAINNENIAGFLKYSLIDNTFIEFVMSDTGVNFEGVY